MRAFLAIEIDEQLRAGLAGLQGDLRRAIGEAGESTVRASWVSPAAMHLTVKFLGEIDDRLVNALRLVVTETAAPDPPVRVPVDTIGAFPRPAEPRALWIGPPPAWARSDDALRLMAWQRRVEDRCATLGIPRDDRPFRPHLTLARIRSGERAAGRALVRSGLLAAPHPLGAMTFQKLTLFKSVLGPGGAVHTKI
ncbi:MAG TPA: RNA 2',3'-cyclic phosphodiesterase [Vicinamibacterales bacterium]|nr:RNA 2',3'-cyclic phosphodiesterase [Vicinamibacterales bacterium]